MQRTQDHEEKRIFPEQETLAPASGVNGRRVLRRSLLGSVALFSLLALARGVSQRLGLGGRQVPAQPPLSARVLRTTEVSFGDRKRLDVRVMVQSSHDRRAVAGTLASLTKRALEDHPDAAVVLLFAYRSEEEAQGGFTVGRAEASRDGRGWDGQGHTLGSVRLGDRGEIEVEVVKRLDPSGSHLPPLETVRYSFAG